MPSIQKHLLFLLISLLPLQATAQVCPPIPIHQQAQIASIQDGDTLNLTDGRRVRLIAINTPELARENTPAQALADDAKQALVEFLSDTKTINLHISSRKKDRYGRVLAHVFHPNHGSVEAHLVALGLAFPIAVPPDFLLSACLTQLADKANQAKRGVWASSDWAPIPAPQINQAEEGFARVCGRIRKVDRAGPLWIELNGDVVIRINQNDWSGFTGSGFDVNKAENWIGKDIELWGWLQNRSAQKDLIKRGFKPWVAQVRSPTVLRWTSTCE